MRIAITALLVLVNFILESTVFPYVAIRGVVPHTALLIVISLALLRGSKEGALVGLASGMLNDIFFGTVVGYYAVILGGIGYLFGRNQKHFYRENYLLPAIFAIAGAALYEVVLFATNALIRSEIHVTFFILRILLPQIVYSAAISIPLYRLLFGINDGIEMKEKYKYRLF